MTAIAAVQIEPGGPLELRQVQVRAPGRGEVKVSMKAAALCHTDVQALFGGGVGASSMPTPLVAGHEGAGIVTEVGPGVADIAVGDHVILASTAHDGTCPLCQDGHPALCMRTRQLMTTPAADGPDMLLEGVAVNRLGNIGTFTSETVMSSECVVVIDPAMPWDVASLIGCGVLTGVGVVRNAVDVRPGEHVVVLGCGGVGMNIVQAAKLAGAATVIAVDISKDKLAIARQFGATITVDATTDDVSAVVAGATGGLGAHYCFESTGRTDAMAQAVTLVRPGGTAVLLGMAPASAPFVLDNIAAVILQEKRIVGSLMGSGVAAQDYPELVSQYLDGSLKLDPLITARRPLAEVNEAIADLEAGIGIRTVFTF